MRRPFKALKIGDKFEYDGRIFVKLETVYKEENCCVPEYNAHAENNPDEKILVSSLKSVEKYE